VLHALPGSRPRNRSCFQLLLDQRRPARPTPAEPQLHMPCYICTRRHTHSLAVMQHLRALIPLIVCAQVSRAHALVDEACMRLSEQLPQDVVAATDGLHRRGGLPPGPEGGQAFDSAVDALMFDGGMTLWLSRCQ
jgi:hypothetical protein